MMEWISVKDKLPPNDTEILTYQPDMKYVSSFSAAWFDGEDFWYDGNGSPERGITHWMPLPEAPKE